MYRKLLEEELSEILFSSEWEVLSEMLFPSEQEELRMEFFFLSGLKASISHFLPSTLMSFSRQYEDGCEDVCSSESCCSE